jgi:hypothetical protein
MNQSFGDVAHAAGCVLIDGEHQADSASPRQPDGHPLSRAHNPQHFVADILGVAEPIRFPPGSRSGVTELSERWVAQSFPALLFADDRGREGA